MIALTASVFSLTLTYFAYSLHTLPTPLPAEQCNLELKIEPDRERGWQETPDLKCQDTTPKLK